MKWPTLRLLIAAVLFVGWIGWLAYLAFTASQPVVLSRPQLLISNFDVIAEISGLDRPVTIQEVSWPRDSKDLPKAGQDISIVNLAECDDKEHGWEGPGTYILPLTIDGKTYQVAPTPRSPGFIPQPRSKFPSPRIYRLTEETRAQLRQIQKP